MLTIGVVFIATGILFLAAGLALHILAFYILGPSLMVPGVVLLATSNVAGKETSHQAEGGDVLHDKR